ncbi:MATE efflux family protein isoform 1 [Tripterygium wilfordii]|uniref:MATE efflux family protein isoform 1 n=1 Tax=Tripterygium wilfordii TaxID=458696 RepID=A0A7J7D1H3_TRIWF|nr:MATE efflux family protein isoform 1 [Tripterygium wilfordii]
MTGNLKNAMIAVDALSICNTINGWEMMIPLAFFAGVGVRVANELGAGNGKAAKFATKVAVAQSTVIGLIFCVLIMIFRKEFALIFTTSTDVLDEVDKLAFLLAITILLNSVQPVLSGVAVGSGWQATVAYINIGCYYVIGLPLGFLMGWVFHLSVEAEKVRQRVKTWSSPNVSVASWEMMIPLAFFTGAGVRVANELGAGNGKAAKFATEVAVAQSAVIGLIFSAVFMIFPEELASVFTSTAVVLREIDKLVPLIVLSILLNSVQLVLSEFVWHEWLWDRDGKHWLLT